MKVSFNLRKDKITKENLISVSITIRHNGILVRKIIPKIKVLEKNWDDKKQRLKKAKALSDYELFNKFNQIMDNIEDKIYDEYRTSILKETEITKDRLLELLTNEKVTKIKEVKNTFFDRLDEFISTSKPTRAKSTIKNYNTLKKFLNDFVDITGYQLTFYSIDLTFFDYFKAYSFNVRETKNNYFAKLTSTLKTFMNWALDREYHNSFKFKKLQFSEEDIEIIYMTMDELMKFYNHDFKLKRLNHVRDIYLFGSFTGLRVSDLKRLEDENIKNGFIDMTLQKGKNINHRIPLTNHAKEILRRYKDTIYSPLPTISDQKYNEYLKECCKIIELNEMIKITRYVGEKRIDKTYPKHNLITSHTARKTFITNSLMLGMSERSVKNITAHKTEKSFRKYIALSEDYKKEQIENAWNNSKFN